MILESNSYKLIKRKYKLSRKDIIFLSMPRPILFIFRKRLGFLFIFYIYLFNSFINIV